MVTKVQNKFIHRHSYQQKYITLRLCSGCNVEVFVLNKKNSLVNIYTLFIYILLQLKLYVRIKNCNFAANCIFMRIKMQ